MIEPSGRMNKANIWDRRLTSQEIATYYDDEVWGYYEGKDLEYWTTEAYPLTGGQIIEVSGFIS